MNDRNRKNPTAAAPSTTAKTADALQSIGRSARRARRDADEHAQLASLPIRHTHAAGIDAGDASHWVCVEQTPDGSDARVPRAHARPASTRRLTARRDHVALEASGVYGHVLPHPARSRLPREVVTAPSFTRQIKGRPKTDKRDCQWIQRLHKHGLLPSIFQPDEATQTLRDYVRQRLISYV